MAAKDSRLCIPSGPKLRTSSPVVDPTAPWRLGDPMTPARMAPACSWLSNRVLPPPPKIAAEVSRCGLMVWEGTDQPAALLRQAALWIGLVPGLAATSAKVVGNVHLLRAPSGYDISHSEPRWRRRIFVSVPEERSDDLGALRLAESVAHEAMHLHLTNHEIAEPLVIEFHRCMKSPWRSERRSYQGVLHGLFVFACLESYFRGIASKVRDQETIDRHRQRRVDEIRAEILSLDIAQLRSGLTCSGAAFAQQWYDLAVVDAR
jgi:hypothetical protein